MVGPLLCDGYVSKLNQTIAVLATTCFITCCPIDADCFPAVELLGHCSLDCAHCVSLYQTAKASTTNIRRKVFGNPQHASSIGSW